MTFNEYVESLKQTYASKNNDYGNSAELTFKRFGLVSYLTRISDKLNRYMTLSKEDRTQKVDEKIGDTLGDAATYCLMAIGSLRKDSNMVIDVFDNIKNNPNYVTDVAKDAANNEEYRKDDNFVYDIIDDVYNDDIYNDKTEYKLFQLASIFLTLGWNNTLEEECCCE